MTSDVELGKLSIPTYVMGVYKLRAGLYDDLTKIIRSYCWVVEDIPMWCWRRPRHAIVVESWQLHA
jgi:hypothetical protein